MILSFQEWPKIHRLYRPVIVTEKIDGTNACIVIEPVENFESVGMSHRQPESRADYPDGREVGGKMDGGPAPGVVYDGHVVYAQSRNKVIAPGKQSDNQGFAAYVREHAEEMVRLLGPGRHYGEWYGKGIQRGYGMPFKMFALFNAKRWTGQPLPPQVTTVPILSEDTFSEWLVVDSLAILRERGSIATGVDWGTTAEGIVVHFSQANTSFKVLLENDEMSKYEAERLARTA